MPQQYDSGWILPYARISLRGRSNLNFIGFVNGVFEQLERDGVPTIQSIPQSYSRELFNFSAARIEIQEATTEAFYYLEQNRYILRPPPTNSTAFQSHATFNVTARGREWAADMDPLPEDYDGYMKQFDGSMDPVVREYLGESLKTYSRETYFASAVMVGAASEKVVYLVSESVLDALSDPSKQAKLREKLRARKFEPLFKYLEQIVADGHTHSLIPFEVLGGTTRHLMALFESIKLQRNDAVHPMNFQVSRDSVRQILNAFPMIFKKAEALRNWCSQNAGKL